MKASLVPTIGDIDARKWDALAQPGGFYSSHRWLSAQESILRVKRAYIVVEHDDELVCAAPLSYARQELSPDYSQQHFAGNFEDGRRFALMGPMRGYRTTWLISSRLSLPQRRAAFSALSDEAASVAAEWGATSIVAPYLDAFSSRRIQDLGHSPAVLRSVTQESVLRLPKGDFDDYLAALPRRARPGVRRERRCFAQHDLTTSVEPPPVGASSEISHLIWQVEQKYHRCVNLRGVERYLRATFESDQRARLFACRNAAGSLVAVTLGYEWCGELYIRAFGADYANIPDESFVHFNVMYYIPIEYALERALTAIYFGPGSLRAKSLRGCDSEWLSHALLHEAGS